jgi:hypothetical protein
LECVERGRNTSQADVLAYERDDRLPRLPNFKAIADSLEISMDDLWSGEHRPAEQPASSSQEGEATTT